MNGFTFQHAAPETQGVPSGAVSEWVRLISELDTVHSFMLMRHDKIIAQAWWSPCRPEYKHELFSLSKSFTSAAIGIAQAEGCLRIDDRLAGFFPEKISAAVSERMKRVTLRHLLTMSSGHETCPMSELRPRRDWVKGFLESSLAFEPGTRFVYNSAATYMLASVIRRTTGQNVLDYLQERLLHPLGIDAHQWDCCPMGTNVGGWGFWLRTEDLLRFGRLLQHNGNWEGRQLIPSDYLREATSKQIDNSDNAQPDWKLGYGFQFWRTSFNSFRADGACGQYVLVMPEQDLVLAVTSGVSNMQSILTHFWNTVYPALRETALEENPEARKQLENLLATREIPPVSSALTQQSRNREYHAVPNTIGLKKLVFHFTEQNCTIVLQWEDGRREELTARYGIHTRNLLQLDEEEIRILEASAAWADDRTLHVQVCAVETPYRDLYIFRFLGNALEFDRKSNFGFLHRIWPRITALEEKHG